MNVYDSANALAGALQDSYEYKRLKQAWEPVRQDPDTKKMVEDFLKKQAQLQMDAISGKETAAKQEQLQKLYELISQNSRGRDYMQAYMRFQLMMEDINKILADAIKPVVNSGINE